MDGYNANYASYEGGLAPIAAVLWAVFSSVSILWVMWLIFIVAVGIGYVEKQNNPGLALGLTVVFFLGYFIIPFATTKWYMRKGYDATKGAVAAATKKP